MPTPRQYKSAAERQAAYQKRKDAARDEELRGKGLPSLPLISTMPGTRRWKGMLDLARALVQGVCDERESCYDDRSEEWQESERGETFLENSEPIGEAREALDGISEL